MCWRDVGGALHGYLTHLLGLGSGGYIQLVEICIDCQAAAFLRKMGEELAHLTSDVQDPALTA